MSGENNGSGNTLALKRNKWVLVAPYVYSKPIDKRDPDIFPSRQAVSEVLLPRVPYVREKGGQPLLFEFNVPLGEFWRLSENGGLYVTLEVVVDQGAGTSAPPTAEDALVLIEPWGMLKGIRLNINGSNLPLNYPRGFDLARFTSLCIKTRKGFMSGDPIDSLLFSIERSADMALDKAERSEGLNKAVSLYETAGLGGPSDFPLPFFMFPNSLPPILTDVTENETFSSIRYFPEKTRVSLTVDLETGDEMKKHVMRLTQPIKDEDGNITQDIAPVSVKVHGVYLMIDKCKYAEGDKWLRRYREKSKNKILHMPLAGISCWEQNLEQGVTNTRVRFEPSLFDSRLLMCFIKESGDDRASQDSLYTVNLSRFKSTGRMDSFHITCGGRSLCQTPVEKISENEMNPSKIRYYNDQIKYHREKVSPYEFFQETYYGHFTIINVVPLRREHNANEGGAIPAIEFDYNWNVRTKSPPGLSLVIYSVNSKDLVIDQQGLIVGAGAAIVD